MPRKTRSKLERALVGTAGEYFVLYRLHLNGVMASLAPRNAPTVDILVLNPDETIRAVVQVKTRTYGADGGWHFSEKHESIEGPELFYALVDFEPDVPVTYILPSTVVAQVVRRSHRIWLNTPGKDGRPHKDSAVRRLRPKYNFEVPGYSSGWLDEYRERWEFLSVSRGDIDS